MMDNKNTLIAIALSAIVLLGWQYFVGMPQMERQRQQAQPPAQQQAQPQQQAPAGNATPGNTTPLPGQPTPQAPGQAAPSGQVITRETALAAGPRIAGESAAMKGSIAVEGARGQ